MFRLVLKDDTMTRPLHDFHVDVHMSPGIFQYAPAAEQMLKVVQCGDEFAKHLAKEESFSEPVVVSGCKWIADLFAEKTAQTDSSMRCPIVHCLVTISAIIKK